MSTLWTLPVRALRQMPRLAEHVDEHCIGEVDAHDADNRGERDDDQRPLRVEAVQLFTFFRAGGLRAERA